MLCALACAVAASRLAPSDPEFGPAPRKEAHIVPPLPEIVPNPPERRTAEVRPQKNDDPPIRADNDKIVRVSARPAPVPKQPTDPIPWDEVFDRMTAKTTVEAQPPTPPIEKKESSFVTTVESKPISTPIEKKVSSFVTENLLPSPPSVSAPREENLRAKWEKIVDATAPTDKFAGPPRAAESPSEQVTFVIPVSPSPPAHLPNPPRDVIVQPLAPRAEPSQPDKAKAEPAWIKLQKSGTVRVKRADTETSPPHAGQ